MKNIGLLFIVLIGFSACEKSNKYVPEVQVNFSLPLTDPRLSNLRTPGGAVIIENHGIAGLILYHRTNGSYAAYDRCSTVNPEQRCKLTLDNPAITATDPCSGAKFLLEDGSPAKAPAVKYLKEYTVSLLGQVLRVTN